MTAPKLTVQIQGMGAVTADNCNTFTQGTYAVTDLANFVGVQGMRVLVDGFTTPGDGGAGVFWWNTGLSGATSDFINIVVPNGTISGGWVRLGYLASLPNYTYQVPATGFAITVGTGIASLILNPAASLATGTITLAPPLRDGWIVHISSSQAVASLTLNSVAGYSISNAPTSLSAGVPVGFQYVQQVMTWFRI